MAYRRTTQQQARLDAVRERIVTATVRRVAEGGWQSATIAAVAADAGVATGTVYRHVRDKDELFAEVFRRTAGHELAQVTDATAGPGPARERLEAALRTFAARALQGRRLAYALLAEPAGAVIEAERLTYRAGYHALFAELLRAGIDEGDLPDHDTVVVAAVLVGAMGEALVGPLAPLAPETNAGSTPRRTEDLVAACLRALPTAPPTTTADPPA